MSEDRCAQFLMPGIKTGCIYEAVFPRCMKLIAWNWFIQFPRCLRHILRLALSKDAS